MLLFYFFKLHIWVLCLFTHNHLPSLFLIFIPFFIFSSLPFFLSLSFSQPHTLTLSLRLRQYLVENSHHIIFLNNYSLSLSLSKHLHTLVHIYTLVLALAHAHTRTRTHTHWHVFKVKLNSCIETSQRRPRWLPSVIFNLGKHQENNN